MNIIIWLQKKSCKHSKEHKIIRTKKQIVISKDTEKRSAWCRPKLHFNQNSRYSYWIKVLFSDETRVVLGKEISMLGEKKASSMLHPT